MSLGQGRFPLSNMQLAYLVGRNTQIDQGETPIRAYSQMFCENYDHARFQEAVNKLIASHDMLRVAIYSDGTQEIKGQVQCNVPLQKRDCTYEEDKEYIEIRRNEIFQMTLKLEEPPLIYFETMLFNDGTALIHLYHDGLIMDGWSHEMVLLDLDRFYSNPSMEPYKFKYTYEKYVMAEKTNEKSVEYKNARRYWMEKIPNMAQPPDLNNRNNSVAPETGSKQMTRKFNKKDYEIIKRTAYKMKLSPFAIFLTAFGKTLSRYSSEHPFLINLPLANRKPEIEDSWNIVGDCSDFMLYEWEEGINENLLDCAYNVQEKFFEQMEYRDFSGIEVVGELQRMTPGVLVAPIVLTSTLDIPYEKSTSLKKIYSKTHTSQVWLDTILMYTEDDILISMDYDSSKIDTATMGKIADTFLELILEFSDNADKWSEIKHAPLRKKDLTLVSGQFEEPILNTNFGVELQKSFKNNLQRVAIVDNSQQLTYLQLRNFAGSMITQIRNQVSGNDHIRVGLLIDKGWRQIAAEVSCAIGNMTFVPLEKEQPDSILVKMMDNVGLTCLVTESKWFSKWSDLLDIPVLNVSHVTREQEYDWDIFVTEDRNEECYCIHSSGTTGQPKGTMLNEAGLINDMLQTIEEFDLTNQDACIAVTNFCHDMSVFDTMGMLTAGGKVVIPCGASEEKNPEVWVDLMIRHNVTVWNGSPSVMEMLLTEKESLFKLKSRMKMIVLGGEHLTPNLAKQVKDIFNPIKFYNVGGPAEATIWSIWHPVTDSDIENEIIPYGRAIKGMKYQVLNSMMQICPPGVEGIMYISGIGLATEYCGMPEETNKRFTMLNGERIYDTGDLGWYLENGEIAIGGRKDQQVEINGKRVELEGVANIIGKHPNIKRCSAVMANHGQTLTAFYGSEKRLEEKELSDFCKKELPIYMQPTEYVYLKNFPVTRNGKIDLKVLAAYEFEDKTEQREDLLLSQVEEEVLDICKEIVGSNFNPIRSLYQNNGNSLDAVKIINGFKKAFDVRMPLVDFLKEPYIKDWADYIGEHMDKSHQEKRPKGDKRNISPLSTEQEAMWMYDTINQDARYTIAAKLEIDRVVDSSKLKKAIEELLEDEEILRVVFGKREDGSLYQRVEDKSYQDLLQVISLPDENLADRFIKTLADTPITLDGPSLYRFYLFQLATGKSILVSVMHHIVADEQSFRLIFDGIMYRYNGENFVKKESDSFFDYIDYKQKEKMEVRQSWEDLKTSETITQFQIPDDVQNCNTQVHKQLTLRDSDLDALRKLCNSKNVSLFSGFVAIFVHTLNAISGRDKIWISIPMSDRLGGRFDNTIGLFIKKVIVGISIAKRQTFEKTLAIAHESILEGTTQLNSSFSEFVRDNGLSRDLNEVYSDMVINFMDSKEKSQYGDFSYIKDKEDSNATGIQLMIDFTGSENSYCFYYDAERFTESQISYITAKWQSMLNELVNNPTALRNEEDLSKNSAIKFGDLIRSSDRSIIEQFLEQAEMSPQTAAVYDSRDSYSYEQVSKMVISCAKVLEEKGVTPNTPVGVYCTQKVDTIVLMFALCAIGGIYVPIDRDIPKKRADYILDASQAKMIISPVEIPYETKTEQIILKVEDLDLSKGIDKPYKNRDRIAYVMFTSGTTGTPKGVEIKERYLQNMCLWYDREFGMGPDTRSILINNYSFDGSLKTIFAPLTYGGCLVLGPEIAFDITAMMKIIRDVKVTHLAGVPSLIKEVISESSNSNYSNLGSIKWTISAGERFRSGEILDWQKSGVCQSKFVNLYGPVECSCAVSWHVLDYDELKESEIPLGEPIYNKRIYLLNEQLEFCKIGETGNIWIGGFGTFDGYIGASREESNLKPDIIEAEEYMYKSGDLGRLRYDGQLIYAGRKDQQVKLNGQRVEVEEIESTLMKYPGVSECVFKIFEDNKTAMFFTSTDGRSFDKEQIRDYLEDYFHKSIVPGNLIQIDEFPLTFNGKIDKSKLFIDKKVDETKSGDDVTVNDKEEKIKLIWSKLLQLNTVPEDTDFFRLGGHSLLLFKCQSELKRVFGRDIPMKDLLRFTTVRQMAEYISNEQSTEVVKRNRREKKRRGKRLW